MPDTKLDSPTPAKNRRRELVQIAYRHIAERGFEGLRIHDVAQEAGINNATLHYYFPTKEALIQGVVDHLIEEFSDQRESSSFSKLGNPMDELRLEFDDTLRRIRERPDQIVVFTELLIRSLRDPVIASIFGQLDAGWREYLEAVISQGIREGLFRPDLDLKVAATVIMALFKGYNYQMLDRTNLEIADQVLAQIEMLVKSLLLRQD